MSHKIFAFILLLLFSLGIYGQTIEPAPDGDMAKRQKEYIDFLRETMTDVGNLRTLENRISFSAELASLMWYYDEREARAMYLSTISDFKELVGQYDLQMKSTVAVDGDTEYSREMFADMPERARIARKFRMAMTVRQQIAMSMAEHDADLAFSFYNESGQIASNPELRKSIEGSDSYFEFQLASQVAQTNPGKAADFGSRNLKKGIDYQHIELLKSIYKKDPEKGAEFAQNILNSLKTEKFDSGNLHILGTLLSAGVESYEAARKTVGAKPMFTEQGLRDISERLAQSVLDSDNSYEGLSYADSIGKFAPARAMQIRSKFRNNNANTNSAAYGYGTGYDPSNKVSGNMNAAAIEVANTMQRQKQQQEDRGRSEKQFSDDIQSLGKKELPREERQKIIDQARAIIAKTPGRNKQIAALSMLAASVAKAGDRELAAGIMKDAHALVNPDPKNAQDFLLTWMLAGGYAESDPDKAFPLLQDTISRLNETISAFVRVGEFIDTAGEMVQDGEVQVGAFGGSMTRNMTKDLGIADGTIRTLARADFGKTKALTNSFDRTEVRILAKMLVLRAVLKKPSTSDAETKQMIDDSPN